MLTVWVYQIWVMSHAFFYVILWDSLNADKQLCVRSFGGKVIPGNMSEELYRVNQGKRKANDQRCINKLTITMHSYCSFWGTIWEALWTLWQVMKEKSFYPLLIKISHTSGLHTYGCWEGFCRHPMAPRHRSSEKSAMDYLTVSMG